MTILGLGLDIVDLARIEDLLARQGERFVDRICREGEPLARKGHARVEHLGGLFAAKEAVLKALGTGWAQGLGLRQVEVVHDDAGAPSVRLHDAAKERMAALGGAKMHLSISHERTYAAAVAILEGDLPSAPPNDGSNN